MELSKPQPLGRQTLEAVAVVMLRLEELLLVVLVS
jgi:hypothetical protein